MSTMKKHHIRIRSAKFSDHKGMRAVTARNLTENYESEYWKFVLEGNKYSFVATESNLIIGYILCDGKSIISFAIDEIYRGKGLGRQLLSHCLNMVTDTIMLHVDIANINAISLYESFGFIKSFEITNYYRNPDRNAWEMIRTSTETSTKYTTKNKLTIS